MLLARVVIVVKYRAAVVDILSPRTPYANIHPSLTQLGRMRVLDGS